jgi:hypothetical protein
LHVPPTSAVQQPPAQLVASQTHWPPLQRWPAPHAAAPPQVQVPELQPSALVLSHDAQESPFVPQLVVFCAE